MELHSLDGPNVIISVDLVSGFKAIRADKSLDRFRISIEIVRVKNSTKNPVAEKSVSELEQ